VIRGADYLEAIGSTFEGHDVLSTDTLLLRRFYGDANLDGVVGYEDYGYVDAGFGANKSWVEGDMDHSGMVTYEDYGYVDAGFGSVGPAAAAAGTTVPEPSTLVLLFGSALAGFVAFLRKR
jgi:hypothetical protein